MERSGGAAAGVAVWVAAAAAGALAAGAAGCGDMLSCSAGKRFDTAHLGKELSARFAGDGLRFDEVICPEEFWYKPDAKVLPCTATLGELEITLPVTFDAQGNWKADPPLPDRLVWKEDEVEAEYRRQHPAAANAEVDCAPHIWLWRGHERTSCKLKAGGAERELVVVRNGPSAVKFEVK